MSLAIRQLRLQEIAVAIDNIRPMALATSLSAILYFLWMNLGTKVKVDVPLVFSGGAFGGWGAAFRFMWQGWDNVAIGYEKYTGHAFQIAQPFYHEVYVCSEKLILELRNAPPNLVSFRAFLRDALHFHHTVPGYFVKPSMHRGPEPLQLENFTERAIAFLRRRKFEFIQSEIQDEVIHVINEKMRPKDEWNPLSVYQFSEQLIGRSSSRMLVGLPLARNQKWLDTAINYGPVVAITSQILSLFPAGLRGIVVRLTSIPRYVATGQKILLPYIRERLQNTQTLLESSSRPDDMLQWLLSSTDMTADSPEPQITALANTLFILNLPAIHTTAQALTHAIFQLATQPDCIPILRHEIETNADAAWTKASLDKLQNLDSFIKETMRLYPFGTASLTRKTIGPFTFTDGTHLPSGTFVSAPGGLLFHDKAFYPNPTCFDPWRFSRAREEAGAKDMLFTSTSSRSLLFGDGRNACPGRFFASDVLKFTLVHILINYDLKTQDGIRPKNYRLGNMLIPNPWGKVQFRGRQSAT